MGWKVVKTALVTSVMAVMLMAGSLVVCAEEDSYFEPPRLNHVCDNVNCQGDIMVKDAQTGLDLSVCVPDSWKSSFDEYRTRCEEYFAEKATATEEAAPVEEVIEEVAPAEEGYYFAPPRLNSSCNNVNCKDVVSVKNPQSGLDLFYCVPQDWTKSVGDYQMELTEYLAKQAE